MNTSPEVPNFDRVAGIYRWAEYLALGRSLERTRNHYLPRLLSSTLAFVLGDGDGRFLAKLLASNPQVQALAVDTSSHMLALLKTRCAFAGDRLQTQQASALTTVPPPGTDLVVSHFFLDCLTQQEVESLIHSVALHCQPEALWLISDFRIPQVPLWRPVAAAYIRMLYFGFRWLTGLQVQQLPQTTQAFRRAGFTRIAHHARLFGMLYGELWQLDKKR